jgi:Leucine-rich repeat (LRR) protein
METDEIDDIAALLEKELELLDDDSEEDFSFDLNNHANGAVPNADEAPAEIDIQNELQELFQSAHQLEHFTTGRSEGRETAYNDITTAIAQPDDGDFTSSLIAYGNSPTVPSTAPNLTPEEVEIVKDLLALMVESVERCAPILARKELQPIESKTDFSIPAPLQLITEDSDVQLSVHQIVSESLLSTEPEKFSSLLADRITAETQQVKDAQIHTAQESDRVLWDESNRFKQEIEQERLRREDRRLKREAAKRAALLEKSAVSSPYDVVTICISRVLFFAGCETTALSARTLLILLSCYICSIQTNIQRTARGCAARKVARVLLQEARAQRLAEEAIAADTLRRQQEAALREEVRLQREREAAERRLMAQCESESKQAWAALAARQEALRQAEVALMLQEDQLATQIRAQVLKAREKLQQYATLAAEEDVEYDFGGYGSDSDMSAASDDTHDGLEGSVRENSGAATAEKAFPPTVSDTTVLAHAGSSKQSSAPSLMLSGQAAPVVTSSVAAVKPSHAPTLKPAPRAPKTAVKVDPTQGKRWGGTFTNSSVSTDAVAGDPTDAASESGLAVATELRTTESQIVIKRPPAYSLSELAAMEAARIQRSQVHFAPVRSGTGHTVARSDASAESGGGTVDATELDSVLVCSLRHWCNAFVAPGGAAGTTRSVTAARSGSNSSASRAGRRSGTAPAAASSAVTAQAERDNEEALRNSMVDWESDPLSARELDFCVEGLTSTTFLQRFANLTKLTINVNKLTELSGLSSLHELVSLSCKDNRIADVTPLSGLKKMKYLYLDSNRVTDLSALSGLPELVVLCANSNQVAEVPTLYCPKLQRLELSRNRITTVEEGCFQGTPSLVHLNLSSNQIVRFDGAALNACPLLQSLALSENQLATVPSPLHLPMLKSLRLNLNRLTNLQEWCHSADDVWPMCTPSLQKLILSDNQISSLPGSQFFAGLVLLEEVDISFNALTERECLQGLGACKLLSALHVQDNVFTTVPVTGAVAGATRTALPPAQQQQLTQWILSHCPGLETVSGNRLDKSVYAEGFAQLRNRQTLEHYLQTGTWLSGTNSGHSTLYQHQSRTDRELITLLQAQQTAQNVLAVTERAVKRDEAAANKNKSLSKRVDVNTSAEGAESAPKRDWDEELAVLLRGQLQQLRGCVAFIANPPPQQLAPCKSVFVCYRKEASIVTTSTGNTAGGAVDVLSLTAAAVTGASIASEPPNILPVSGQKGRPTTLPAEHVTTLQRHFRGRRVRTRLGSALKSIRYQDDELDDLLGDADFNLAEMMDLSYLDEEMPVAMVYGDHIRRRSRPGTATKSTSAPIEANASATALRVSTEHHNWVLPADDAHSPPKGSAYAGAGAGVAMGVAGASAAQKGVLRASQSFPSPSRPSTGVSTLSAHSDAPDTAARGYGGYSGAPSPADSRSNLSTRSDGLTPNENNITMLNSAQRSARAAQKQQTAQEWGISDPKVLAAMMKRSQRLR